MTGQLQEIAVTAENILQLARQSYTAVEGTLRKLKEHILNHEFRDTAEEIDFFKRQKPMFLRELFYFHEVFQIEAWKPPVGINDAIAHYMIGAKRMDLYFKMNNRIYTYYRTGSTEHDEEYFLREKQSADFIAPLSMTDLDPRFSTPYSIQFAQLEAFEQFSNYITESIRKLENPGEPVTSAVKTNLVWTDAKTDLIELGYAIFARKSTNFGKSTLRDIMTVLEGAFNVRLGNYHRTFQNMRIRKIRTPFLTQAEKDLNRYMDQNDQSD